MLILKIRTLDNRVLSTTSQSSLTLGIGRWPWVQDVIAEEFNCDEDDIASSETDDGDVITVRGEPVAQLFVQVR